MVDLELMNVNWTDRGECKPKRGSKMGINTIEKYKKQIILWFEIKREDTGNNMSAALMSEALKIEEPSQ